MCRFGSKNLQTLFCFGKETSLKGRYHDNNPLYFHAKLLSGLFYARKIELHCWYFVHFLSAHLDYSIMIGVLNYVPCRKCRRKCLDHPRLRSILCASFLFMVAALVLVNEKKTPLGRRNFLFQADWNDLKELQRVEPPNSVV